MLDIQFIRENPELVAEKAKQKGYNVNISELLELDAKRRSRLTQLELLKADRNALTAEMKGKKPSEEQVAVGKQLKEDIAAREVGLKEVEGDYTAQLFAVPNITFDDVPIGGEEDSVEIKVVGDKPTGAKDHLDYAVERDWVDFERGAKVAGAKFYFLKGDLALLENAITQYALQFVLSKGFTYMTVPHMVNTRTAMGAGFAPRGDKESNEYYLEGEDLTLIGTAEAPLTGYHADEIIDEAELPKLYVG